MTIFSFWNDKKTIPAYLNLCVETWKRFIPNHEIKILDVDEFLSCTELKGSELWKLLTSGKCSWAVISDFIRMEILSKYGGVWMDIDTIVTGESFAKDIIDKADLGINTVFGNEGGVFSAFIISGAESEFLKHARERQHEKIMNLNEVKDNVGWDYLCYSVILPYFRSHRNEFNVIDASRFLPEKRFLSTDSWHQYRDFYFTQRMKLSDIPQTPIIVLHNSWTPAEYKRSTVEEIMSKDCTMSNILRELTQ